MNVLVINPGNSLKAEIVACQENQRHAFEGKSLLTVSIECIGKVGKLTRFDGRKEVHSEPIEARDSGDAAKSLQEWIEKGGRMIASQTKAKI